MLSIVFVCFGDIYVDQSMSLHTPPTELSKNITMAGTRSIITYIMANQVEHTLHTSHIQVDRKFFSLNDPFHLH
jgi:hypothetical protein